MTGSHNTTSLAARSNETGFLPYAIPGNPSPAGDVPVGSAFSILWRRKFLTLAVTAAVAIPAVFFVLQLPTYYKAESSVMVEPSKTEFNDLQASSQDFVGDTLTVRTQTDLLNSDTIALRVVDQLHLTKRPEFLARIHQVPLRAHLIGWVAAMLGQPVARTPELGDLRQLAVEWLKHEVLVTNDGRSYTITVTADMPVPALSAAVANAYTTQYLGFLRDLKVSALQRAHAVLDEQIEPLQERVRSTAVAVEAYREKHGLILNHSGESVDGATVAGQQLALINAQLTTAQATLTEKLAHLRAAQRTLHTGYGYQDVPEVMASPLIQRMQADLATNTSLTAGLGQTYGDEHPKMLTAVASNATLRQRLNAEVGKIVAGLQNEARSAQSKVDSLQKMLATLERLVTAQSAAQVGLMRLGSEADAARVVYRDYLMRYQQTSSQMAFQEPDASLISSATTPIRPAGPPRLRFSAVALLAASIIGSVVALAAERLRGGFRTAEQLAVETGLFPLGSVPRARRQNRSRLEATDSVYTAAVDQVDSLLRFGKERFRARSVMITSAAPGEGKTFFAISLAASVGRQGGRALLVDADVRRPRVAATINGRRRPAQDFSQLGSARVVLQKDALRGVDVMTILQDEDQSGSAVRRLSPSDLEAVLNEAKAHYDLIVVDVPPVLAIPDAQTLVQTVDGAILVVQWRATPSVAVNASMRTLSACGARILGGVLTLVRIEALSKAEGSHAFAYRAAAQYFR